MSLSIDQLNRPDPKIEKDAFGTLLVHQAALSTFTEWLEKEAVKKAPKIADMAARFAMCTKSSAERILAWALDEPAGLPFSIAARDLLALPRQVGPKHRITTFQMRQKQWSTIGIKADSRTLILCKIVP